MSVRVTNQMMVKNMLTSTNSLRSRMLNLQQQVSSGLRITKNSEDPSAGGEVMRVQGRFNMLDQWDKNLANAKQWTRETEAALADMTDLMSRARELAVQAGNLATMNADDRKVLAIETESLLEDLIHNMNRHQADGALFGGFQTATDLFSLDMTTGEVTFAGDSGAIMREIGPGVTLSVNLNGNDFGDWSAPDNMLTAVWQMAQDLRGNPTAADMENNLNNMDKSLRSLLALRANVGSTDRRLDLADGRNKAMNINLHELWQQAQGAEMEKAIMELTTADTTYRAALQVGARIIPPTLVDFLR
jgi:flagellar hook-associated protein 3 FlgL